MLLPALVVVLLSVLLPALTVGLLPALLSPVRGTSVAEAAGAGFPPAGVATPLAGGTPFAMPVAEALAGAGPADAAGVAWAAPAAGGAFFPPAAPARGLPSAVTVN